MERTARPRDGQVLEVERPAVVGVGRLRLIGFPMAHRAVTVVRRPLDVRTYDDAVAVSLPSEKSARKDAGGAYQADGRLIVETERAKPIQRWWPTPRTVPAGLSPTTRYPGRTFYAGRYVIHFGHILLEVMTRFWPELDYDAYDQFVFIPKFYKLSGRTSVSGLLQMMAGLSGAPSDRIVVAGPEGLAFEHLDVPSSAFELALEADPRFLDGFDRIADRIVREQYDSDLSDLPKKIYLSRSQLDSGRPKGQAAADNETEAEAFFQAQGFAIVHPQKLPFTEQVALARNADLIAGCNGSALHLAMFARPGTGLLALDIRHVGNQYLIDQARGLDAVHVWARSDDSDAWQTPWSMDLQRVTSGYDALLADGLPQPRDR